jgi:hypothetical protein
VIVDKPCYFPVFTDIDECAEFGTQICRHGICKNTIGSFSCQCDIGYTKDDSQRDCRGNWPYILPNLLFAALNNFLENIIRKSNVSLLHSNCEKGCGFLQVTQRILSPTWYIQWFFIANVFLSDMNECVEIEGYCSNGTCTNTVGGSICECTTGFTLSPSGDKCIGEFW